MKRTLITIAASLGFLLPSTQLTAQTLTSSYNVPFTFQVAGVDMPAGRYILVPESSTYDVLRGPERSVFIQRHQTLSAPPRAAHLTFNKYGESYFLSEVWERSGNGVTVPKGSREREIQRTTQEARNQSKTVLVAAAK